MGLPWHKYNAPSFDDAGAPVPSVGFDYPVDEQPEAPRVDRRDIFEVAVRIALYDGRGKDAMAIGRRLLALQPLLAELLGERPENWKTIAERSGTSGPAVSMMKERLAQAVRHELFVKSGGALDDVRVISRPLVE